MRKVRALLIIAALWGAAWFVVGVVVRAVFESTLHADFEPPPPFLDLPIQFMVWGAVSGAVFTVFLMVAERRQTLQTLSLVRVATWGALGCLALPLAMTLLGKLGPMSVVGALVAIISACSAMVGAVCAVGTLALAKRAPLDSTSGSLTSA